MVNCTTGHSKPRRI
nr:unnamed protein product [Callosobruchus chinensis]